MAVTTTKEFLEICLKSRLLTDEQFADTREWAKQTDDPRRIAATLAKREIVTRWQAHQLLAGRTSFVLGKYKLIKLLGRRGMGNVFLGRHTTMNRPVAIKIVSRKIGKDPAMLKRFLAEARAIAALDHENIVRAYSVDKEDDAYYMVMEYVEGRDLKEMVDAEGPLDDRVAADCIRQAANGLGHAHERKLIHGDIKPSSLLVSNDGVVKILDIGMSQFAVPGGDDSSEHAELGPESVDFLAPELADDNPQPDPRADVYSLGCTFYYLLTGHPPFPEGSMMERIEQHRSREPAAILDQAPDVSKNLVKVCRKMMAKNPDDRFRSATVVNRVLDEVIQMEQEGPQTAPADARPPLPKSGKSPPKDAAAPAPKTSESTSDQADSGEPETAKGGHDKASPTPPKREKKGNGKQAASEESHRKDAWKTLDPSADDKRDKTDTETPPVDAGGKPKEKPAAKDSASPAPGATTPPAAPSADKTAPTKDASPNDAGAAKRAKPRRRRFSRRHRNMILIGGAILVTLLLLGVAVPVLIFALGSRGEDGSSVAKTPGDASATPSSAVDPDDEPDIEILNDEGDETADPQGDTEQDDPPEDSSDAGTDPTDPGDAEPGVGEPSEREPDKGTDGQPPKEDPKDPPKEDPEKPPKEDPKEPPKEDPKEPPKPEPEDPFRAFPSAVALASAKGGVDPVVLGTLDIKENVSWDVRLIGGESALKGTRQLAIEGNGEKGTKAAWMIQTTQSTRAGDEIQKTAIARVWHNGGNLMFQWNVKKTTPISEGALRSCLFEVNVNGDARTLALFGQKTDVAPIEVNFAKKPKPYLIPFEGLPDPAKLRMEVTRVEAPHKEIRYEPKGPVPVGAPLLIGFMRKDCFNNVAPGVTFQVKCFVRRDGITVDHKIVYPPVTALRRCHLSDEMIEQQKGKFQELVEKKKGAKGPKRTQIEHQMRIFDEVLWLANFLKTMRTQTVKIHYRIFAEIQGCQVDVARTEPAAAEGDKKDNQEGEGGPDEGKDGQAADKKA